MTIEKSVLIATIMLLTVIAGGLRLPRLEQRPLHGDESGNADNFRKLLEDGDYKYETFDYHGPTLNYLNLIPAWIKGAEKITQVSIFDLRIVAVFFGAILVLMLPLVSDGLGRLATIIAAALTTISPAMVFYSRYYIQEMLLVCFTFGLIASGYRYLRSGKLPWAISAGVFLGLMHATKETFIVSIVAVVASIIVVFLWPGQRKKIKDLGIKKIKLIHVIAALVCVYIALDLFDYSYKSNLNGVVYSFIIMLVLLALLIIWSVQYKSDVEAENRKINPLHVLIGIMCGITVSVLFFSSFFSNPHGFADSILAYTVYLDRGTGAESDIHVHPWYYYLQLLIYSRFLDGPIWSESPILILAAIGFVAALTGKYLRSVDLKLIRFLAFYTLFVMIAYSAIAYKTPWCMLGFLHGLILLAGVGVAAMFNFSKTLPKRVVVAILLAATVVELGYQTYITNFKYYDDSRNPYVYAHPTSEIFIAIEKIEQYAQASGQGHDILIDIICIGDDYWPLPWYLRSYKNIWYGNETALEEGNPKPPRAPLIIASQSLHNKLAEVLYSSTDSDGRTRSYVMMFDSPYYIWLRPEVPLEGYVRYDLWQAAQRPPDLTQSD